MAETRIARCPFTRKRQRGNTKEFVSAEILEQVATGDR